ncbi:hypothetical protein YS110_02925 [Acidovorax sp. YS12]|nr:hypothetical protein YS110_02925 [Acidovorax sp. YS12]
MKARILAGVFAASLLMGCGDAPLLMTPLQNGYTFDSNGGYYGFIRNPSGQWLYMYFGMQDGGVEYWCNEFGWKGDAVVCAMGKIVRGNSKEISAGYFILNTRSAETWLVPDEARALEVLRTQSVSELPKMARRHPSTSRKWFVGLR